MYTSSSNHSSQVRNFFYAGGNCGSGEEEQKRPSQTYFFPPPSLQNCTIPDVDNVESSHLIKLVHAVQSLKRKKKLHLCRESGQIIKYKLISVLIPCSEHWIAFRKLKRYGRLLTLAVRVYHLLLESSKREKKKTYINSAALILYIRILEWF